MLDYPYIGARNNVSDGGSWIWVNGETANSSELFWFNWKEPKSTTKYQWCVIMTVGSGRYDYAFGRSQYSWCTGHGFGLCEKKFSP